MTADWTEGTTHVVVSRCAACGHRWYIRRPRCPHCGSREVRRSVSAGAGTVAAQTVLHPASGPPFGVCLVDLTEGIRVMARCTPSLPVGEAVTVEVAEGTPHARSAPLHTPDTHFT
jgi:uncharacterized OB-fold protein